VAADEFGNDPTRDRGVDQQLGRQRVRSHA
jgi:hypothetical protein